MNNIPAARLSTRRVQELCAPYMIVFLHLLAVGAIKPITALFITEDLRQDPLLVGVVLSAFGGAMLVSSVPGGVLGDRIGARATVVLGTSLLGISGVLMGSATNIAVLMVASIIMGVGNGVYTPSLLRIVSISTGQPKYGRTMSIYSVVGRTGGIVGPMLGGVLVTMAGLRAPFFAYGLLTTLGMLIAISSLPRLPKAVRGGPRTVSRRQGLLANFHINANVSKAGLVGLIFSIAEFGLVLTTLSIFYSRMTSFDAAQIGILFSVNALGAFAFSAIAGPVCDHWGHKRFIILGVCVLALTAMLIPFLTHWITALAVIFLFGSVMGALQPLLLSYIAASSPEHALGTAMGVFRTATAGGHLIGPLLAGMVMNHYGVAAPFFLVAIIATVGIGIPLSMQDVVVDARRDARPSAARAR